VGTVSCDLINLVEYLLGDHHLVVGTLDIGHERGIPAVGRHDGIDIHLLGEHIVFQCIEIFRGPGDLCHEIAYFNPVLSLLDIYDVCDARHIEEFRHAVELIGYLLDQGKSFRVEHPGIGKIDDREDHDIRGELIVHLYQKPGDLVVLGQPGRVVIVYL